MLFGVGRGDSSGLGLRLGSAGRLSLGRRSSTGIRATVDSVVVGAGLCCFLLGGSGRSSSSGGSRGRRRLPLPRIVIKHTSLGESLAHNIPANCAQGVNPIARDRQVLDRRILSLLRQFQEFGLEHFHLLLFLCLLCGLSHGLRLRLGNLGGGVGGGRILLLAGG